MGSLLYVVWFVPGMKREAWLLVKRLSVAVGFMSVSPAPFSHGQVLRR